MSAMPQDVRATDADGDDRTGPVPSRLDADLRRTATFLAAADFFESLREED